MPLGFALCGVFVAAVRGRFARANPTIAYYALFILLTAIGVSAIRSGFGYDQSFSGRYKIYSDLLIICAYIYGLHAFRDKRLALRHRYLQYAMGATLLFFCFEALLGWHQMRARQRELRDGMTAYIRSGGTVGPYLPGGTNSPGVDGMNAGYRKALQVADHDGIYHPRVQ